MPDITDVKGVSDARAEDLAEAGYTTVDDLATADFDELTDVSGIGPSTADDLIESAQDVIRENTLQDEQTQEDDDYEPTEVEEPTEEELRELVEDESEDDPDFEDIDVEDDDDAPEETTIEIEEPYTFTLELETVDEHDYLYHAILSIRIGQIYVNGPQAEVAEQVLDELRELDGTGSIELTLNTAELNALFTGLRQAKVSYQGIGDGKKSFMAITDVVEQIQSARDEFLQ